MSDIYAPARDASFTNLNIQRILTTGTMYTDALYVNGSAYSPGSSIEPPSDGVIVGPLGSGAQFTSIQTAYDYALAEKNPSYANIVVLYILAGEYTENVTLTSSFIYLKSMVPVQTMNADIATLSNTPVTINGNITIHDTSEAAPDVPFSANFLYGITITGSFIIQPGANYFHAADSVIFLGDVSIEEADHNTVLFCSHSLIGLFNTTHTLDVGANNALLILDTTVHSTTSLHNSSGLFVNQHSSFNVLTLTTDNSYIDLNDSFFYVYGPTFTNSTMFSRNSKIFFNVKTTVTSGSELSFNTSDIQANEIECAGQVDLLDCTMSLTFSQPNTPSNAVITVANCVANKFHISTMNSGTLNVSNSTLNDCIMTFSPVATLNVLFSNSQLISGTGTMCTLNNTGTVTFLNCYILGNFTGAFTLFLLTDGVTLNLLNSMIKNSINVFIDAQSATTTNAKVQYLSNGIPSVLVLPIVAGDAYLTRQVYPTIFT